MRQRNVANQKISREAKEGVKDDYVVINLERKQQAPEIVKGFVSDF